MSDLWRVTYRGNLPAGDVFAHGFHGTTVDGETSTNVLATAVAGLTALMSGAGGMQANYAPGTIYAEVLVEQINQGSGAVEQSRSQAVSRPGTGSSATPLPGNVALAVTHRTAQAGRSGRGRQFLPAPATSTLSTVGELSTTAQSSISTAIANMFAAVKGATHNIIPVVYSTKLRVFYTITQYDVGSIFDTQERRRNKLTESRVGGTI